MKASNDFYLEDYLILIWPNKEWCYSHSLERFQQEMGLSDDYRTLHLQVGNDIENVDDYIETLVSGGAI